MNMDVEKWLKLILYLLVAIVLFGILGIVFQQAFTTTRMMGPSSIGVANSVFMDFLNFFFYSLIVILVLVILASVFIFSIKFAQSLFEKK
ncbi:hypothetical protein KO561_15825 [Radiobacillus kanasensis]|uniref:hypothetical protein n=1 Tax=Radiobacillus kanasensis TaxID=2844358 RepID=UPI001E35D9FD|nr:hypothetical protein [Radiobacillus kanasensis]UFT98648.1 hypothetical protein KO561_15825 [Radiobacillus kanasensis]